MNAVEFNVTVPGYLLAKCLGRLSSSFVFGRLSRLALVTQASPALPGEDWVRINVLLCGICGSDLGNIAYASSPAMEPLGSFPAILGHEVLGRVVEVGSRVRDLSLGQRVAVDPMLHCDVRGYPRDEWCASCGYDNHATCEHAGEDGPLSLGARKLSRGLTIGYHRDLPGGWGEQMIAHRRQVFAVPDAIPDRIAVLAEPFSIGMHGVLRSGAHRSEDPILVIGSGAIALGTIWALRALGFQGVVMAQVKRPHEAALARSLGASDTFSPGAEARQALIDTGARAYMPVVGDEVYVGGGYGTVFDCVGSRSSVMQSFKMARARGRIVLLGCAGRMRNLDLTFLWAKELDVQGYVGYGAERVEGREAHTFDITLGSMVDSQERHGGDDPLAGLVTHVYPLTQYRDALAAAYNHRRSGAIKVVLQP